ncbi:MAG: ATP synthase F0 subunit B, partial [Mycoplasmataceae bacterium]|nr:ATP synthase F0 subunit B [Mycoplasmataceae bacterium]
MIFAADTQQIMDGIIPSLPEFIAAIVCLAILLIVITFLMYKPIKKSITDRKNYIHSNIEHSEKRKAEGKKLKLEAEENIKRSKDQAENIITSSVREANEKSNNILADAKDKSQQIIDSARNQAKSEISKSKQVVKDEAVD